MKKALCILNGYVQQEGPLHFFNRMREELVKFDIELEAKTNLEICTYINEKGRISSSLKNYEFCLYLDKDTYIARMLELEGIRLFNSMHAIFLCDDKMITHISLANNGIKMPLTISAPLNYSNSENDKFIESVHEKLNFPLIAKRNYGSLGNGVFLIHNLDELKNFEHKYKSEPHLYQEFIESSFGHDYRIIIVGGKFVAGMRRENGNGDFRSNIAKGGIGIKEDIPQNYIDMAIKASKILNLDYCGVDLLQGRNNEPILCEVNSNAFIKGIEKTTGVNVAKKYAEHIIKSIKEKQA